MKKNDCFLCFTMFFLSQILVSHTVELIPLAPLTKRCADLSIDSKFYLKKIDVGELGSIMQSYTKIKAVLYTMTSKLKKGISSCNKIAFSAPTMCCASLKPLSHLEGPRQRKALLSCLQDSELLWSMCSVRTNGIRENIQKQA